MRLTKSACDAAAPKDREYTVWDDAVPGFGLRVHPTGRKTFILKYRTQDGRQRKMSLGRFGALTPEQARREAQKVAGAVASGLDPAQAKQERRQAPTVRDLVEKFDREHVAGRKPKTQAGYRWLMENKILPTLGTLKVAALDTDDISDWHKGMSDTPGSANRALTLLGTMLQRATITYRWRDGPNPVTGVEKYKERKRERYLSATEFLRIGQAISDLEKGLPAPGSTRPPLRPLSPYLALAFRLLMTTGMRRDEVLGLRWDSVDLERGTITLTEHKTDDQGAKRIVLSEAALELLRDAPRVEGSPWVVTGRCVDGEWKHVASPAKAWARIKEYANTPAEGLPAVDVSDLRIHDLRHSFASIGVAAGLSLPIIGGLLGHADVSSTQRYAHLDLEAQRVPANIIAGTIATLLNGESAETADATE